METLTNETNELRPEFLHVLPCQRSAKVLVKNCILFLLFSNLLITGAMETHEAVHFRTKFLHVLLSRRSAPVPLVAERSKPVANPIFQSDVPSTDATESSPKEHMDNLKDMLNEENIHLHTEAYASRGYVAIGLDSRYHGERADSKTAYQDALISSWKNGNTMPFIFDTVWDLIKLAEYLTQRKDIDPQRIGIAGISLGGMQAWFAAAADTRYSVAVPLIGVQGFRWAIDNDAWQGRVDSLKPLFEKARIDMGKSEIDKEVVKKVWDRIAPGLASQFDAPYSVPVIAPRPLYLLNGAEDPRCPLGGLVVPVKKAKKAYKKTPGNFKFVAEAGVGHTVTSFMIKEASDWFDKFL
ncbi:alpha/beta-Hydrolases superfamily protein [Raphanus sativus]|nr:alpha/beta-Hydrolases superfamily protein [Raphanus sativus]